MSEAIGPGDWVECVDASPDRETGVPVPFSLGSIHRIDRIKTYRGQCCGFSLAGVPDPLNAGPREGWAEDRFRPIYRPNQSIIEQLKQPAPEREPETV